MSNEKKESFGGDKKATTSLLHKPEQKFIKWAIPKIPKFIHSWQLTLFTIVWSAGAIYFGWLSASNELWLIAFSGMVFGQWLTDSLDGTLGKTRGEGLVKWGFFMDHFLDTVFSGSLVIGYAFLAPGGTGFLFSLLLMVTMAMMALSFLSFAATNRFTVAYHGIGPTEIRISYILLNLALFLYGNDIIWVGLPAVLALNFVILAKLVIDTHRELWAIDKEALKKKED